ncbi:hypothetical protein MI149_30415 (plasmid) [Mycolicibacterium crocinum]|uniref:Transposase n=1 Tax=Mycolicibacterium crocinum TaxID=388459 RepID=A0ABY5TT39_9MYCO|nr:hypothetical protein [Mycolicibacterium crocinum]UVY96066.1 hypothetical protein MI149_30415 [Mycolicibacterium crocinum]
MPDALTALAMSSTTLRNRIDAEEVHHRLLDGVVVQDDTGLFNE